MTTDPPHRKLVRHYDEPGHAHALTFSCYHRLDLLVEEPVLRLLGDAVRRGADTSGFGLAGFVFMPNHVQLLVYPTVAGVGISRLLAAIKRPSSYRIKQHWEARADSRAQHLTVSERPGKMAFRFWQEGGGFDENLNDATSIQRMLDYIHANPVRRGLCADPGEWQWSSWRQWNGVEAAPGVPLVDGWPEWVGPGGG